METVSLVQPSQTSSLRSSLPELAAGHRGNCSSKYQTIEHGVCNLEIWAFSFWLTNTHCGWSQWQGWRYRGEADEAWQSPLLREQSHRQTSSLSQHTPPLPIQADSSEGPEASQAVKNCIWLLGQLWDFRGNLGTRNPNVHHILPRVNPVTKETPNFPKN